MKRDSIVTTRPVEPAMVPAIAGQDHVMQHAILKNFTTLALAVSLAFLVVVAPAAARETKVAPALWKIETAQGRVWLFGSFHILPKDMAWRSVDLNNALSQAQELVFEINMDDAQDPAKMGTLVRDYGFLPPGQSLHRMLATEYRTKLDATLKELGLPTAGIDRMRPWLAALTITSLSAMRQTSKAGGKSNPSTAGEQGGADIVLWNWAKANNKERGALETIDSQIHIFADLTHDQEVQYLIVTLQQADKLNDDLDTLLKAWQSGDLKRLDKELNGDTDHFPQMRDALLTQRHAKWVPQIEQMLSDGKTHVVIVGAAHLVGKGSVVDLLRAKGIKVEGP